MELWFVFANFQSNRADMSRMKPDCDFKTSMIYLFVGSGNGISRHDGSDRKIYKGQPFYVRKAKWRGSYQINDVAVWDNFGRPVCQLPRSPKLVDCYPYVIEER